LWGRFHSYLLQIWPQIECRNAHFSSVLDLTRYRRQADHQGRVMLYDSVLCNDRQKDPPELKSTLIARCQSSKSIQTTYPRSALSRSWQLTSARAMSREVRRRNEECPGNGKGSKSVHDTPPVTKS
jgi:hypothetical protein